MKKVIKITKSQIMKNAWKAYKIGYKGIKTFAEALKMSWAEAKKQTEKRIVMIADWFATKKLGLGRGLGYELRKGNVIKETEKAVLVNLFGEEIWCPKSTIEKEITYTF